MYGKLIWNKRRPICAGPGEMIYEIPIVDYTDFYLGLVKTNNKEAGYLASAALYKYLDKKKSVIRVEGWEVSYKENNTNPLYSTLILKVTVLSNS
jgi:hypothetical protein